MNKTKSRENPSKKFCFGCGGPLSSEVRLQPLHKPFRGYEVVNRRSLSRPHGGQSRSK